MCSSLAGKVVLCQGTVMQTTQAVHELTVLQDGSEE